MTEPASRFRTGRVAAAATPAERARELISESNSDQVLGAELMSLASDVVPELVVKRDLSQLAEFLVAISESNLRQRTYFATKLAVTLLIQASMPIPNDDVETWAPLLDAIPTIMTPYLDQYPAEPELLNFAGYAYFELGITTVARRLFETVTEIEPEHPQARTNLAACKTRADKGRGNIALPEAMRPGAEAARPTYKRYAESASRTFKIQPTIALCMIVKNEEEMLPGCLAAVAEHVDEMIIVDTGSTDRTREIAAEYGATVKEFTWTGSFSDARNFSVEGVQSDWILYLDADEHLVDDDGKYLRQLVHKTWVEAFYLHETNHTGEFAMGTQTTHMAMRLFQNRPEYRWQGIIHEQKLWSFPTYLPERFQNSTVRINHYGYLSSVMQDRDKMNRNLELLLQQAEEGDNTFTEFNIGSEYAAINDWPKAREHFEKSLSLAKLEPTWQNAQFAPMLIARLVSARRGVGAHKASIELIDEALGWWPDFTDLLFERALDLLEMGDKQGALSDLERALALGDAPAKYVAVQGKGSFQARVLKANVLRSLGSVDAARDELERALEEAPHYVPTVLELADVLLETEPPDAVAERLDSYVHESSTAANILLGSSFFERGAFDHAKKYFNRVLAVASDHSLALVAMAELQLAENTYDLALETVKKVPEGDVLSAQAAGTEFLAGIVLADTQSLARPLQTITSAHNLPTGHRAFYTAWHARVTGGTAILAPDPVAADLVLRNLEALAKLEATEEFERLLPLLESTIPEERERRLRLGNLYLRRHFMDMAAEEYMICANRFGPDPETLTGLGKVATMKELWDDAQVFLNESLKLDPTQQDAQKLLQLIETRES